MSFFPGDYEIPTSSNYLKFKNGLNKFRILDSAIIGWVYWTNENKPVRTARPPASTPDIKFDNKGEASKVKHFWAFPVYNWDEKRIQILEVTQSTVQEGIKALVDNTDWGDPWTYNIAVTRTGDKLDTTYVVQPSPKTEMPPEILAEYKRMNLDLKGLYEGRDPFAASKQKTAI